MRRSQKKFDQEESGPITAREQASEQAREQGAQLSPELVETHRVYDVFEQETASDRANYDRACDAARVARDSAYNLARAAHARSIQQADDDFDAACTAAWKTYFTSTDASRHDRDRRLDEIRQDLARAEMAYTHDMAASAPSGTVELSHAGYSVHIGSEHLPTDLPPLVPLPTGDPDRDIPAFLREEVLCPRCMTANERAAWDASEDGASCPNCGQHVKYEEFKASLPAAAPDVQQSVGDLAGEDTDDGHATSEVRPEDGDEHPSGAQ